MINKFNKYFSIFLLNEIKRILDIFIYSLFYKKNKNRNYIIIFKNYVRIIKGENFFTAS